MEIRYLGCIPDDLTKNLVSLVNLQKVAQYLRTEVDKKNAKAAIAQEQEEE